MDYHFFGLTLNNAGSYRKSLFTQIHNIVYHDNGGYDWYTVYNMPIWLRKFTFNSIQEFYLKEREEYNKAQSKYNKGKTNVKMDEGNKQKIPDFIKNNPTYSSTVSKNFKT